MTSIISTLVLILIALGYRFRHQPKRHIPLMSLAFITDVALVLYIELNRHAIATVTDSIRDPGQHQLLLFHVSVSLLTLILYIAQITSGIKLFKQSPAARLTHRRLAISFVVCRLTNYVTSFFLL